MKAGLRNMLLAVGVGAGMSIGCTHSDGGSETDVDRQPPTESSDCNGKPVELGDEVPLTYTSAPLPQPRGGALTPGTYQLVRWERERPEGAETGDPVTEKKCISFRFDADGRAAGAVFEDGMKHDAEFRWENANGYLFLEYTCSSMRAGAKEGRRYTATNTSLLIFADDGDLLTYERQ